MLRTLLKENSEIRNSREKAHYSILNWKYDLEPRLREGVDLLLNCSNQEQYFRIIEGDKSPLPHFQLSAYNNRVYPPAPGGGANGSVSYEEPASLVYSMHLNGSVIVSIYPHKSGWSKMGREKSYTIAAYRSANELSGIAGNSELQKHLELFIKVAAASVAIRPPTRRGEKLLRLLEDKDSRYSSLYSSTLEHKQTMISAELGLAAGLIGGLIASTIFPLSQMFGKEKFENAERHKTGCLANYVPGTKEQALCLTQREYQLDSAVGQYLSTGVILTVAIIVAFLLTILMRNRLRSR
ncbi:hypothetical protein NX773_22710 [Massilia solisilvae]|uniref:Uncharacterized protein n=1 Tax=Massilia solisilvae TaxID=1811225 RepID=A0ABT2BR43_9BURK|nr:hypothetical protein [Massilia solisilvae]MCS0610978.1 hypothetical protein [Massilia solisilvae]